MKKNNLFLMALPLLSLFFAACSSIDGVPYFTKSRHDERAKLDVIKNIPGDTLTIEHLDEALSTLNENEQKPELLASKENIENDPEFKKTPTGSYVSLLSPGTEDSIKIDDASAKIIDFLGNTSSCEKRCSEQFKNAFKNDKKTLVDSLSEITKSVVANEIANKGKFTPFYHGFGNEFRLYQDVLRVVKSFEYLEKLDTTFPFRDFAFTDEKVNLENFLKEWWNEYLKQAEEEKLPPTSNTITGLSIFPDAIGYARNYLLATNINFLGNTFSPVNSTPFFFLNSTGANPVNVDPLIQKTLSPYLKNANGEFDQSKFDRVVAELKNIFEKNMSSAGGQMAQIFVDNEAVPKTAFLSWNGGEPVWFSKRDNKLIFRSNDRWNVVPPNVFWPNEEQQDYVMPDIIKILSEFVDNPSSLVSHFPPTKIRIIKRQFRGTDLANIDKSHIEEIATKDFQQARLLPNPQYFTDENSTGVKIYSFNEPEEDKVTAYNDALFQVIRNMMNEFLRTAREQDFKEGNFPLKQAFIEMRKEK